MSELPHMPVISHIGATYNFDALEKRIKALEKKLKTLEEPIAWNALPYEASWEDLEAGKEKQKGEYGKDALGLVHVRGAVKSKVPYAYEGEKVRIAKLPEGFRPKSTQTAWLSFQKDSVGDFIILPLLVFGTETGLGGIIQITLGGKEAVPKGEANNGNAAILTLPEMIFPTN